MKERSRSLLVEMKNWEVEFVRHIRLDLAKRRTRNPRFSIRQHAKKLDLSPGALSEILRGKRKLSEEKASKILQNLEISSRDRQRIFALMGRTVKINRSMVDPSKLDVILDWVDHAILGLYELGKPQINAAWIAKKIAIPLSEIEPRIQEFLERGLLVKEAKGRIVRPREDWAIANSMSEEMRAAYAKEQLKLAQHALDKADRTRTVFSSITFTGTQAQIERFRTEILKIFNKLSALSEGQSKTDLIRISVQAFPFEFSEPKTVDATTK